MSITVSTSPGESRAPRNSSAGVEAEGAGRVTQNAVNRALANLSLGPIRKVDRSRSRRRNMAVQEMELQYQMEFSGEATDTIAWDSFDIAFDYSFHYAPSARDSDLDRPQFLPGVVIEGGSPVLVSVCVTGWNVNPDEATVGATLAVGVCVPGIPDQLVPFSGYLHLTFQGYGGVIEDESNL